MQNDLSVNLSFRRPYQSWSVKSFTSLNTSRSISSSIKNRTENHVGNDQNIMSTSLMIKLLKLLHCCIIVTDNRDRQKKTFDLSMCIIEKTIKRWVEEWVIIIYLFSGEPKNTEWIIKC